MGFDGFDPSPWVHPDTILDRLDIPHRYGRAVRGQGFTNGGPWRNGLVHQAPWCETSCGFMIQFSIDVIIPASPIAFSRTSLLYGGS